MIDIAQVAELAQSPATHTLTLVSCMIGIAIQSHRNRVAGMKDLADAKDAIVERANLHSMKIGNLDTVVRTHIANAPTEAVCLRRMGKLPTVGDMQGIVHKETKVLRDELFMLAESRDQKLIEISQRLQIVEDWQTRHDKQGN